MPLFLTEDEGTKLSKKTISVPKGIQQQAMKKANFIASSSKDEKGFKEMSSLGDSQYNHRKLSNNSGNNTVSFSFLKGMDHRFRNMNPKSEEYNNIHDEKIENWVHDTIRQARDGVKEVLPVKPNAKPANVGNVSSNLEKNISVGGKNVSFNEGKTVFMSESQIKLIKP